MSKLVELENKYLAIRDWLDTVCNRTMLEPSDEVKTEAVQNCAELLIIIQELMPRQGLYDCWKVVDDWKARALLLEDLCDELVDPDPCDYDHHGYCQAHALHERPCPHERFKTLQNAQRVEQIEALLYPNGLK